MSPLPNDSRPRADLVIRQHADELIEVLPSHLVEKGAGWISGAVAAVRKDKNLWAAANNDPGSMMNALSEAARLGLHPGTEEYHLTPRKGSILGITGYQGEIELIYRAGAVSSVIAEVVKANDKFTYKPGRDKVPDHEIDWDAADRGDLRLVYAYCIMKDGATSRVVILNKSEIEKIKASSDGATSRFSPWVNWTEAMWLKSAVHQLAKWVPTSAEYVREQMRAARDVANEGVPVVAPTAQPQPSFVGVDVETGELTDEGEVHDAAPDADWGEFPE